MRSVSDERLPEQRENAGKLAGVVFLDRIRVCDNGRNQSNRLVFECVDQDGKWICGNADVRIQHAEEATFAQGERSIVIGSEAFGSRVPDDDDLERKTGYRKCGRFGYVLRQDEFERCCDMRSKIAQEFQQEFAL